MRAALKGSIGGQQIRYQLARHGQRGSIGVSLLGSLVMDFGARLWRHINLRQGLDPMAEESTNGQGESRLDRMERLMELLIQDHLAFRDEFRDEIRQLLTAQVVLTDRVDKLAENSQRSHERMDALIAVVDGIVRRQPPQSP